MHTIGVLSDTHGLLREEVLDVLNRCDAILHGDHAQLVRLVYLSTLRSLDEAGRIAWRIYKTPSQYAREMHQDEFSKMTYHFQRVRYGKFGATPALYEQMKELQGKVLKGGES